MYQNSSGFLRQEKVLVLLVIVAFILEVFSLSVAAKEKPAESAWEFHVTPYL